MGVDDDRRSTAAARRLQIIGAVERLADPDHETMARWREVLSGAGAIITDGDIDGLVSSIMLGAVSDYRIKCILLNGRAHLHPEVADLRSLVDDDSTVGLDVMLAARPSISNHVLHIGPYTSPPWLLEATTEWDDTVDRILAECSAINLSGWCRISARHGTSVATSAAYRYPLGTAQLVLSVLELLDRAPRFYDRRFMPWMVANADGGVTSIRDYPWNVDVWWSSLAAAVGPASMSEALYRLVSEQRPSSFRDADRALRHETRGADTAAGAADCLDERWNVSPESVEATVAATRLLQSLSGWPDPFHGGVELLPSWPTVDLTGGTLPTDGLSKANEGDVRQALEDAASSIHFGISTFDQEFKLFWQSFTSDGTPAPANPPPVPTQATLDDAAVIAASPQSAAPDERLE